MGTSAGFVPAAVPECPYAPRMTRAQALALRAAAGLLPNCVVVLSGDTPTIGNAVTGTSPTTIELNPISPTEFGLAARVGTTLDDTSWAGLYDIDLGAAGSITRLTDNLGNTAQDVDADAPTVHTQFPWGVATWRDNYAEDSTFTLATGQVGPVTGNRFLNTALDTTGWTPALFNPIRDNTISGGGTHHLQGTSSWVDSTITGSTVNCAGGARIDLTGATIIGTSNIINNATVDARRIAVTRSLIDGTNLTQNSDVSIAAITVANSEVRASTFTIDAGALKAISVGNASRISGCQFQCTGGTIARSLGITQSDIFGAAVANEINHIGDCPISISRSRVTIASTWVIDGSGSVGLNMLDSTLQRVIITKGPASDRLEFTAAVLSRGAILHNGSGNLSVTTTQGADAIINSQAGSTGALALDGTIFRGGGTITMTPACQRASSFLGCTIAQSSTITLSGTTPIAAPGDRYDNTEINAGKLTVSGVGNASPFLVTRCRIRGTSQGTDGALTISGTSAAVWVDDCEIEGVVTISNVPAGALSAGTAFHDNNVRAGSTLTYDGGDATAKQVRNNTVEGLSTVTITGLTGSAGGGLADLFACRVGGQSVLTMTGARVVGQPTRNVVVDNGSTLNIPGAGTLLQCSFRNGATVNGGAFRHSETVVEGAFTKTFTAANVGRLCTKGFDDTI